MQTWGPWMILAAIKSPLGRNYHRVKLPQCLHALSSWPSLPSPTLSIFWYIYILHHMWIHIFLFQNPPPRYPAFHGQAKVWTVKKIALTGERYAAVSVHWTPRIEKERSVSPRHPYIIMWSVHQKKKRRELAKMQGWRLPKWSECASSP